MTYEPLILLTPPQKLRLIQGLSVTPAHQAYRIGKGPHLLRAGGTAPARGGLMAVDCVGMEGGGAPGPLCDEVTRECAGRGFLGVVCDFERRGDPFLEQLLRELGERLSHRGWRLFIPEWYAHCAPHGHIMISSALSGGSLTRRLEEAAERYGRQRVTLAIQRVAEDFFLPSPKGSGTPLGRQELKELMERLEPSVFFSNELCARYFTYMSRENGAHFVLFDDGDTILKKLRTARGLGISTAIAAYDEVDDILERLASRTKKSQRTIT